MHVLSSERGTASLCCGSLIRNEDFQKKARGFVRNKACTKGETNLTICMLTEWVKAEYRTKISNATGALSSAFTTKRECTLMAMNEKM